TVVEDNLNCGGERNDLWWLKMLPGETMPDLSTDISANRRHQHLNRCIPEVMVLHWAAAMLALMEQNLNCGGERNDLWWLKMLPGETMPNLSTDISANRRHQHLNRCIPEVMVLCWVAAMLALM
ncbi:hypothetical protein Hamer_G006004, partial [Homarus americanus]